MSASRMPTLSPRSRRPSARLTAVVDLPTPPLPEATAMIAATPGMPDGDGAEARRAPDRVSHHDRAAVRRPAPLGPAAAAVRRGAGASRPLGGQRHHHRFDARHGADRGLGTLAHRLPRLHRAGIDGDRQKNLAVAGDDFGELASCRQGRAVGARNFAERCENVVLEIGHDALHRPIVEAVNRPPVDGPPPGHDRRQSAGAKLARRTQWRRSRSWGLA